MTTNFFERLRHYYRDVAAVLRGEASAAAIFPNGADIGDSREQIYLEFLRQHAPMKCNVFKGGFVFDQEGAESSQLDIIVTTDLAPRFDFHNANGGGKAFSPVEGTLAVFSIKSTLDKKELFSALDGLASIPPTRPLDGRTNPLLRVLDYEDWPFKVIYASNGISLGALWEHLQQYYAERPEIPLSRRPNFIHVAGKYLISRVVKGMGMASAASGERQPAPEVGSFVPSEAEPDLQGIVWILDGLQQKAMVSSHIQFAYGVLINRALMIKDSAQP